jgi:hypothetical protein
MWESGGTVPRILNLGAKWRRVVSLTLWPLYLRDRYRLYRRLVGPQNRFGRCRGEKHPKEEQNRETLERKRMRNYVPVSACHKM